MSLNQIVASDRLRPLLEGVVEAMKPAAVSSTNGPGECIAFDCPAIKVKPEVQGAASVRKIVEALIVDGGGAAADPIADTISFDGMGLYFVGAGSARNDEITFESNRTDAEAPNLYLNAREGDDQITVRMAAPPPGPDAPVRTPAATVDAGDGQRQGHGHRRQDRRGDRGRRQRRRDHARRHDGPRRWRLGRRYPFRFRPRHRQSDRRLRQRRDRGLCDVIGSVSGGDGDDQIVVGSRNATFVQGAPEYRTPTVSGGAGDDVIAIAGKADVAFAKGRQR